MFDMKLLKEHTYDIPVICVGNITVGGTGKTPHTEMLLRLLLPTKRVAVLSRGYKRKSHGFKLATPESSMREIGDEPWQMKHKFPRAIVAVDANRRHGIERLMKDEQTRGVEVIVLDDAFQHRYVKAGLNIMLTDYHRLITDDALLPAGRLREQLTAKNRAHVVIVTKCPANMTPMEFRVIQQALDLKPFQHLFFTTFHYGHPYRLFNETPGQAESITPETHVILLTGIASPQQMQMDLRKMTRHITPITFADHHAFSPSDISRLEEAFTALQGSKRLIVTTEKDAARLRLIKNLSPILRRHIVVLPIEVQFLRGEEDAFRQVIAESVGL